MNIIISATATSGHVPTASRKRPIQYETFSLKVILAEMEGRKIGKLLCTLF